MDNAGSNKICIVTTSRGDLFALSRNLARAFTAEALADASRPVFVSVCGSLECGKKIIADAVREELLGEHAVLSGRPNYDERWIGARCGETIEVDYLDSAHGENYSLDALNQESSQAATTNRFLKERRHGGVTFIQNDIYFAEKADIRVWLQKQRGRHIFAPSRLDTVPKALREKLARADLCHEWSRLVEIDIQNPAILGKGLAESAARLDWAPDSRLAEGAAELRERIRCTASLLGGKTASWLFSNGRRPG